MSTKKIMKNDFCCQHALLEAVGLFGERYYVTLGGVWGTGLPVAARTHNARARAEGGPGPHYLDSFTIFITKYFILGYLGAGSYGRRSTTRVH